MSPERLICVRPRDFGEFLLDEVTTKVAQRGIVEAL
jgi:hypothetical protein